MPGDTRQQRDRRPRVLVARWTAPVRIDLDPEHQWLCWSRSARPTRVRAAHVGEELLECFVRLVGASADETVWGLAEPSISHEHGPPARQVGEALVAELSRLQFHVDRLGHRSSARETRMCC